MAPKNNAKGGDKKGAAGKGKGKDAGNDDKSKVKGAQSINVRHILVSFKSLSTFFV
jgi:NIMA-interacting peptidyl-prolyl cis-trans isomerase 4